MADDLFAAAAATSNLNPCPNPSSSQPHPPPASATHNTNTSHYPFESEDISNLLHTLLHNNSSSSAPLHPSTSRLSVQIPQQQQSPHLPISHENRRQFLGSGLFGHSPRGIETSPGINFAYLGEYIADGAISSPVERIGDLDFDSEKDNDGSENLANPSSSAGRSSSKRCRDAEVHNLSEKRRRQRINEKMKALQKLIPNSNKTDKASMLDEAIEYLKQLQLQVQMLTMRNGSTLHPFYLPNVVPSAQPSHMGVSFDDDNRMPSSRGTGSLPANIEFHVQTTFDVSNRCGTSEQKLFIPRVPENANIEHPFGLEASTSGSYRPFNLSVLSKDSTAPPLHLDMSRCGENSSPGVSS